MLLFRGLIIFIVSTLIVSCVPSSFQNKDSEQKVGSTPEKEEVKKEATEPPPKEEVKQPDVLRMIASEQFAQRMMEEEFVYPLAYKDSQVWILSYVSEAKRWKLSLIDYHKKIEEFNITFSSEGEEVPIEAIHYIEDSLHSYAFFKTGITYLSLNDKLVEDDNKEYQLISRSVWNNNYLAIKDQKAQLSWIIGDQTGSATYTIVDLMNDPQKKLLISKSDVEEKIFYSLIDFEQLEENRSIEHMIKTVNSYLANDVPDYSQLVQDCCKVYIVASNMNNKLEKYDNWVLVTEEGSVHFYGNLEGISDRNGERINKRYIEEEKYYYSFFIINDSSEYPSIIVDQFERSNDRLVKTFEIKWNEYLYRYELK